MNKNVVTVWSVFIVIFMLLGLLGFIYKDILIDDSLYNSDYTLIQDRIIKCNKNDDFNKMMYQFTMDDANNIKTLVIKIDTTDELLKERINNINDMINDYVTVTQENIDLTTSYRLVIDPKNTNYDGINAYKEDLNSVGIKIYNIKDVDVYEQYLDGFTCE